MDKAYFQKLYDYNAWANRRVWDCIETLTDDQFVQELDYSVGSIYNQTIHMMFVEHWWFQYFVTGSPNLPNENELPARHEIRATWDKIEAFNRAYLGRLTPEELQREVRPEFWGEDASPVKIWEALVQIANHSTDHRAQTLAMLHTLGADTIAQDFLQYLWDQKKATV